MYLYLYLYLAGGKDVNVKRPADRCEAAAADPATGETGESVPARAESGLQPIISLECVAIIGLKLLLQTLKVEKVGHEFNLSIISCELKSRPHNLLESVN